MEEVDRASSMSYTSMEKYMSDFDKATGVLEESKKEIPNGLKYLEEELDDFSETNGVPNADGSEVLDINTGGRENHIRDQRHPNPDQGNKSGGSLQRAVGQTVAQG